MSHHFIPLFTKLLSSAIFILKSIASLVRFKFQTILKKFLSAVFTGSALEFSAICWGYVCGILKVTRFAQVRRVRPLFVV